MFWNGYERTLKKKNHKYPIDLNSQILKKNDKDKDNNARNPVNLSR